MIRKDFEIDLRYVIREKFNTAILLMISGICREIQRLMNEPVIAQRILN